MTDREKLIELCDTNNGWVDEVPAEQFADYLIANGVTFATDTNVGNKWISVEDGLPVETYQVLTIDDTGWIEIDALGNEEWMSYRNVTHWMPLPEPPKED